MQMTNIGAQLQVHLLSWVLLMMNLILVFHVPDQEAQVCTMTPFGFVVQRMCLLLVLSRQIIPLLTLIQKNTGRLLWMHMMTVSILCLPHLWQLSNLCNNGALPSLANFELPLQTFRQQIQMHPLLCINEDRRNVKKLSRLDKAGYVLAMYGSVPLINHIQSIGYAFFLQDATSTFEDTPVCHMLQPYVHPFLHAERYGSDEVPHNLCRSCGRAQACYISHRNGFTVGISIAQNVRGVKKCIGILQVMKTVAATNFLLVRVGLACLRFNMTKCFAVVLIVQQLSLSLLTFFMAMTVPMLMPALA